MRNKILLSSILFTCFAVFGFNNISSAAINMNVVAPGNASASTRALISSFQKRLESWNKTLQSQITSIDKDIQRLEARKIQLTKDLEVKLQKESEKISTLPGVSAPPTVNAPATVVPPTTGTPNNVNVNAPMGSGSVLLPEMPTDDYVLLSNPLVATPEGSGVELNPNYRYGYGHSYSFGYGYGYINGRLAYSRQSIDTFRNLTYVIEGNAKSPQYTKGTIYLTVYGTGEIQISNLIDDFPLWTRKSKLTTDEFTALKTVIARNSVLFLANDYRCTDNCSANKETINFFLGGVGGTPKSISITVPGKSPEALLQVRNQLIKLIDKYNKDAYTVFIQNNDTNPYYEYPAKQENIINKAVKGIKLFFKRK